MATIHSILEEFREAAQSNRDMGDKFENLIAGYLRTDPLYADKFEHVWLWSEWPGRNKMPDTGIDVVAKDRYTGEFCAIQCKFYDPASTLDKSDIDSFFTASGKAPFTSRIIVSTTDKWSKNAEDALQGQQIPVTRLRVQDLADSPIDWSKFSLTRLDKIKLREKKQVRPHQETALKKVVAGFKETDRGKLIMACGTGKTFTALRLAEKVVPKGGTVLFLVPSISLLSQSLREWTAEATEPLHALAVCSDTKVGKKKDDEDISAHDLALPATTDAKKLVKQLEGRGKKSLTVIFSTYQSIQTISDAQKKGLEEIELIVCDEAHRTTGVTVDGEDESAFVRVHDSKFLKAKKRLYMTATPRIYSDAAKTQAEEKDATLCSMDDEALFGPEFHRLGFSEAVANGLLSDYKVMVLAVDEKYVSKTFQNLLAENSELNLEDAVKITGCWNGLSKRMLEETSNDGAPMRRAVAFSRSIKDSKRFTELFSQILNEFKKTHGEDDFLECEVDHVDGTFNALARNERLDWLKAPTTGNTCRILSNARCLSEGVDVPALDAVMFLNPRNSVVDVVQSVGRVMRKAEGKQYGYIILPIGVPADVAPDEALQDNKKYRVVWQVLQALRAHDDRFNATVNQIELNKTPPEQIQIIGVGGGEDDNGEAKSGKGKPHQFVLAFPHIDEWREAIYAKIVLKCGDRRYWESWAGDVAKIAERHTARIAGLLEGRDKGAKEAFNTFLAGLQENINPSIDKNEAIEMLSQHLITRPVFDALFENYSFAKNNPVSVAMQEVLDVMEANALEKEIEALRGFYEDVRKRVKGINNAEGRQKVVIELYDKFFKNAFPKLADRLGIVYTPVDVVDFVVHSAEAALREHFGVGLTDRDIHILDPFTGTGTFIVRMLQSGLISPKDLERKYSEELHANEIILLAYYIAAINVEETYHGLSGNNYTPFEGIVLTDTFQLNEDDKQGGFGDAMFPENHRRVKRQKNRPIRVVIGNPPYSAQQESQNDNNRNFSYPVLDSRIRNTYAAASAASLKKNNYDSYIRAIRWATDRIRGKGVIAFVTNGSFIDANNMDGVRLSLYKDFTSIYCFNLRGNQRTSGEVSRKEGGKIFDAGSRTPVAITILIKKPEHQEQCQLWYYDIGDYLSREAKLRILREFKSIKNVPWRKLTPSPEGDWINQRNPEFDEFIRLGDKTDKTNDSIFSIYSLGVATNRDAWVYGFSKIAVAEKIVRLVEFYNSEVSRYQKFCSRQSHDKWPNVDAFVNSDSTRIAWTRGLKNDLSKGREINFERANIVESVYRPFTKEWLYFDRRLNEMVLQIPRLFPTTRHPNVVLSVTGIGSTKPFSTLAFDRIPDLESISKGQCFPLYWYEKVDEEQQQTSGNLFSNRRQKADDSGYIRRDAITDWALEQFVERYSDNAIKKDDIFYYIYGLLHSPQYVSKYRSNLSKTLPRIPLVGDFWAFSNAGKKLADLHLKYESVEPFPLKESSERLDLNPKKDYRVTKMAFRKSAKEVDKTTIIYNSNITLTGIPLEAYEYVVNGKSAVEWVMERYQVTRDADSQIVNDPNEWSDDPKYIVNLLKRVVRVSVETVKIVKSLPPLGNVTGAKKSKKPVPA